MTGAKQTPANRMQNFPINLDAMGVSMPLFDLVKLNDISKDVIATLSIGKLHFRSTCDSNGFDEEVIPLHVVDGVGDLLGLIRRPKPAARRGMPALAGEAGPGHSTYADYDRRIRDGAIEWLKTRAAEQKKPWCLFVSFVKPHFPLGAPPR